MAFSVSKNSSSIDSRRAAPAEFSKIFSDGINFIITKIPRTKDELNFTDCPCAVRKLSLLVVYYSNEFDIFYA